jgi:hypothetical protein
LERKNDVDDTVYRLEYYSVVVEEDSKTPVFVTLGDTVDEIKEWATLQMTAMLATAMEEKVILPFDASKMQLWPRAKFRREIGQLDLHTAEYAEWYGRSIVAYLTFRVGKEVEWLSAALRAGEHKEATKFGDSLRKSWFHLFAALESCDVRPVIIEHEPDARCASCSEVHDCSKGLEYMLHLDPAKKILN